jgi:hypothetical protein
MISHLGNFISDAVEEIHQALIGICLRVRAVNCYASHHIFSVNLPGPFFLKNWLRHITKKGIATPIGRILRSEINIATASLIANTMPAA